MDNAESIFTAAQGTNETPKELNSLNEGFLGAGSSIFVELSYVAMALIAIYIAVEFIRYCQSDIKFTRKLLEGLGLKEK